MCTCADDVLYRDLMGRSSAPAAAEPAPVANGAEHHSDASSGAESNGEQSDTGKDADTKKND